MRRLQSTIICVKQARFVSVAAPLLHFPVSTQHASLSTEEQMKKNTSIAIDMIQRYKGKLPEPYKRKYTKTINELESEIESILGGATNLRRKLSDDQPMDKLTLIERCLRHAL